MGLDGHKDCIDLFECSRIFGLHYPALVRHAVFVKDSKVYRLLVAGAASPPSLKCAGVFESCLLVEIVSIEQKGLPFRIENSPIRFFFLSCFVMFTTPVYV